MVAVNHQVQGAIEIRPQIRPEVKQVIKRLRQRGIQHIAVVSGDYEQPTKKLLNSFRKKGVRSVLLEMV